MRIFALFLFFVFLTSLARANDALVFSENELQSFNDIEVDTEQSLSDNLNKEDAASVLDGTWVGDSGNKLKEKINKLKEKTEEDPVLSSEDYQRTSSDPLKKIVKEAKKQDKIDRRSNVSVFDISGVMLRMSVVQAESALRKRGFKKIHQYMQIPNFIKWRNEEKCRNSGVVGYEALESCVTKLSKKEEAQYIERAIYEKKQSTEKVEIFMTSNFTDNKIHKIIYQTEVPVITGNSQKALYLRNIKIFEFWKQISLKYGPPDDKAEVAWGLGVNKPSMRAKTGFLVLEDPMLVELDMTRMSREDQKYLNTGMYTF